MSAKIQKIVKTYGPQLVKVGQTVVLPRLKTFWKYARVELRPPYPSELPQVVKGFANIAKNANPKKLRTLTVKEAFINTVVTVEVCCWFFVGECIGKGTLIGYQVQPRAMNFDLNV